MDLATLLGLVSALAVIVGAILMGGGAAAFINLPGLMIVLGGSFATTLIKHPLSHMLLAFRVAIKAFVNHTETPEQLIAQIVDLAATARREGLLGLEQVEVTNPFLQRGIQLVVDGHKPEFIREVLRKEIALAVERHSDGEKIFLGIGEVAPAMGMIGTLIGLVQMMANMDDPKKIGPAMAVALLTTLYGAVIANAIALPIAAKLAHRSREEMINKSLILEGISSILEGVNPRIMEDMLKNYLPHSRRDIVRAEVESEAEVEVEAEPAAAPADESV